MNDFFEKGWSVLELDCREQFLDEVVASCAGKYNFNSPHENLNNRVQDGWRFSQSVKELAMLPQIRKAVEIAVQGKAFPFQTLNFCRGSQQPLHSDNYHFASRHKNGMCGVWVALEDINASNGPLKVVSGSHKEPCLFPEDIGVEPGTKEQPYKNYKYYEEFIESRFNGSKWQIEELCLKKGQAVIWHSNLVHGGAPILDKAASRLSQVTHYFRSDSVYFTPINSTRGMFGKSYRLPFDVGTGERAYRHLSISGAVMDIFGQ